MTKYVMDRLSDEMKRRGVSVDCFKMEEANINLAALSEYDALGIAYPTHSLNAPKIVIDFAKKLPKSEGMHTFIIYTCSLDDITNYVSSNLLKKKLAKRGYEVFYDRLVEMPCNFAHKRSKRDVIETLSKAKKDIPQMAQEILELNPYVMDEVSRSKKILAFIARSEWLGAIIMGKHFYAKGDCICCGKCARNCPKKNVVMKEKKIRFGLRCNMCMRCIYNCPVFAIDIHRPFKFIRFDKWYDSELFK
ncbi:MAG: EFR1 family ferrodoxin [Lachnospiraceae bacterium]|nr:EFR1 family ferrodoxin [Lachnospiraceae bacterium]